MKTMTGTFGFENLLTFLLPGLTALMAVVIGCFEWADLDLGLTDRPPTAVQEALRWAREVEFITAFVILSIIALLGSVVASLQAAIETWVLDCITRWRVKENRKEYTDAWDAYLVTLTDKPNPYIARVLFFFQFETRLGLTGLPLGAMVWWKVQWLAGVVILVAAVGMYFMGAAHHKELAEYRWDRFCKPE